MGTRRTRVARVATVAFVVARVLAFASLTRAMSYNACPERCHANKGQGSCARDGACACAEGFVGGSCASEASAFARGGKTLAPRRGPSGGGTVVTITGVGFDDSGELREGLVSVASCRFGEQGIFSKRAWVPAAVVNATAMTCRAPAWSDVSAHASMVAEVEISFSGYPVDGAIDDAGVYENSTWEGGAEYFMYYDVPSLRRAFVDRGSTSSVMITGETADQRVAVVAVVGGPFIDGVMSCRFGSASVTAATFVSATKITCPMCDADANGSCGGYHQPLWWLSTAPTPVEVAVEFSMNGADFHPVAERLAIHGVPRGIAVTHERANAMSAAYEANFDAGASTMTLDPIVVNLVDANGTPIEDDYGVGGTRGFTIRASLNAAASVTNSQAVTLSTAPSVVTTTNGRATFQLVFNAPLAVGDYFIDVVGEDCTGGGCLALASGSSFSFTVVPGIPAGLVAVRGSLNTGIVPADLFAALGRVFVFVVDAAGNRLNLFDEIAHNVSAVSLDAHNVARTVGSTLAGARTVESSAGVAVFEDLALTNPGPTGARAAATTAINNLTYAAPSRGSNGSDDVYRILFTAAFTGSSAPAMMVFTMTIGRPRYLEIDNHAVISLETSALTATIASSIVLRLYDAGNNLITSHSPGMQVKVGAYPARNLPSDSTLEPTTSVIQTDTVGAVTWTFGANSITLHTEPAGYYQIGFYVIGSDYIQPAVQLIQLTPGTIGFQWRYLLANGNDVRFSGVTTPLGDLKIYVGDISGSALGSADRFDSLTAAYEVWRTFVCSSGTLSVVGTLTGDTQGTGEVTLTGITLTSPTLGAHTISCISTGNTWKDAFGNVIGSSSAPLQGLDIHITVTAGVPVGFAITNSPRTSYSSSLGKLNVNTFRTYSADYYVPLDAFTMKLYDLYANEVTYALQNVSNRIVQLTYISGVANDVLNRLSDYVMYNNTVPTRDAFIVADPYDGQGTLEPALSATNTATLSGLALKVATVGAHIFNFSVPAYPSLSPLTSTITVTLGRSHHLAIRAPCDDYYLQGVSCTQSSTLSRSGAACTCTQYKSLSLVKLTPIYVVIMDGGNNLVGANYVPVCRPGDTLCTPTVEAVFDMGRTNPCMLSGSVCAATQPTKHTKNITSGGVVFDDIAFRLPKASIGQNKAALTFKSFGLVDVNLMFEIFPGTAAALDVMIPSSFEGTIDGPGLSSSAYTLIGKITRPFVINVIDAAGNNLGTYDTTSRSVIISVVNGTSNITGALNITTSAGAVVANNFFFSSPVRGNHVLQFSSSGLTSYNTTIKIIEGQPTTLKHIATVETITSYASAETVTLGKFTVYMTDAGGELMLANQFSKSIKATVKSLFNSTRTSTIVEYATRTVMSPLGRAIIIFDGITVLSPQSGAYRLTFSGDGLKSSSVDMTFTSGSPSQLYVPLRHGYPTPNDAQYDKPTTFAAARQVSIPPFVVVVTDGGLNEIGTDTVLAREVRVSIVYAEVTDRKVFSANPSIANFTTSNGIALISAIKVFNPLAGTYNVTVRTDSPVVLKSATFQLTITSGDVSALDACGCLDCVRAPISVQYPVGLCTNTRTYASDDFVQLQDVVVVTRDAGGLLMGSMLNTLETRAVNVRLISYTLVDGQTYSPTGENSPMIADASDSVSCLDADVGCVEIPPLPSPPPMASPPPPAAGRPPAPAASPPPPPYVAVLSRPTSIGALYVRSGVVAWCADGTELHPAKNFCTPSGAAAEKDKSDREDAYLNALAASGGILADIAGTPGVGLDFYGIRTQPAFVGDANGLRLNRPKAGRYILEFTSTCLEAKCPDTQNLALIDDYLEIVVEPGTPHKLQFTGAPLPRRFDNNVTLPTFEITTLDIADNILESSNETIALTVKPTPYMVFGDSAAIVNGKAVFDKAKIIGRRGVEYNLTFTIGAASIAHDNLLLTPCDEVKRHSVSAVDGQCECIAGYTEDHNVSGYVNSTSVSSFPDLYSQIIADEPLAYAEYVQSLRPYGVCVPCGPGFYKPTNGSAACVRCPTNMDTYTGNDGQPSIEHTSFDGESLPGYLGNTQKSACQCTVAEEPTNKTGSVVAYYRLDPPEAYTCGACPEGATCDSRDITKLKLSTGYWRANVTTLKVVTCRSPYACGGGVGEANALCEVGYTGPLCGRCDANLGYASLDDSKFLAPSLKCEKCWNPAASIFAVIILLGVQLFVVYRICGAVLSNLQTPIVYTKLIISHFQMLAILGFIDLGWPNATGIVFPISRVTTSVSLKSFAADCLTKWSHLSYTIYSLASVLVFAVLIIPYFVYTRVVEYLKVREKWYANKKDLEIEYINARQDGKDVRSLKNKLDRMKTPPEMNETEKDAYDLAEHMKVSSDGFLVREWKDEDLMKLKPLASDRSVGIFLALVLYMCWVPILSGTLQMILTSDIEDLGSFLNVDYRVRADTNSFTLYLICFCIGAVAFTMFIPYVAFSALKKQANRLDWTKTMSRYGFLYLGFTKERYLWEVVVFFRKGALIALAVLLPSAPLLAAYLCVGVIQLSLALVLLIDLYEKDNHRRMETISLVIILISYNSGALMNIVNGPVSEAIACLLVYALNLAFVGYFLYTIRNDLTEELIASKIKAEKMDLESEHDLRREAVQRALVDTHRASRSLHPRMATDLIAAFDDQTLVEELSKPSANDLKLKHVQLSVHLESIRNKWRRSKTRGDDPVARRDHETAVLALERKKAAVDHNRWRQRGDKSLESSGKGEAALSVSHSDDGKQKSLESDDSPFNRIEARVTQYNEIMAQQRVLAERTAQPTDSLGRELERVEPMYPTEYVPQPPRLPAQDSVSWNPPAAEIMLASPLQSPPKATRSKKLAPKELTKADPFTYDYFEMNQMRDALTIEDQIKELELSTAPRQDAPAAAPTTSRLSWRERMNDSRWRVQRRIDARQNAILLREYGEQPKPDVPPQSNNARKVQVRDDEDANGSGSEANADVERSDDD